MDLIKWTNEYSVGIEEIDNQHKGLIIVINELFSLMSEGKAQSKLIDIFDYLTDYTKKHFKAEEDMMLKYSYHEFDQHKLEHINFIDKLSELKEDYISNKITISLEILNFLKDWLINHILITDKKYSKHIKLT